MSLPTPAAKKSWLPTRKWIVAELTAAGTLAGTLMTGDTTIVDSEKLLIIGFIVQAVATYLVPNKDEGAVGGVPVKGTGV